MIQHRVRTAAPKVIAASLVLVLGKAAPAAAAPDASPPPESAQAEAGAEADAAAQQIVAKGLALYDLGEYEQAIEQFQAAYERLRSAALIFNMAQSYRLAGNCRRAVDLYRQFTRLDPTAPERPRAEAWLEKLGGCSQEKPQADSRVGVALPAVGGAPAWRALARVDGPTSRSSMRTAGGVLMAVAAGLAVPAGYFAWQAKQREREIETLFRDGGAWTASAREADDRGRQAQQTATTLLVAAGISAILGLAGYLYGSRIASR